MALSRGEVLGWHAMHGQSKGAFTTLTLRRSGVVRCQRSGRRWNNPASGRDLASALTNCRQSGVVV